MHTIRLQDVLALRRPCPHPNCGTVFEIALEDPHALAKLSDYRCDSCDATIEWAELKHIRELIGMIQSFRRNGIGYELIVGDA